MEVLGEFEAEGNCGNCGVRLRIKESDIRGYNEKRSTLPQYGEDPSYYNHPVYYITCDSCQQRSEISQYSSSLRVPPGVFADVKAKRWDGDYPRAQDLRREFLHPRVV